MHKSRQRIALALVTALAFAAPASADGIALRWTNCVADGGTSNMVFACNTNLGVRALVPSFTLDAPLTGVTSIQGVVDVVAGGSSLPEWWRLQGCRNGVLTISTSIVGPIACLLLPGGGGINSIVEGVSGANTVQITFTKGVGSTSSNMASGVEYVVTALRLNLTRTVGTPSCSGCFEGVCLTLNGLTLARPGGPVQLTTPYPAADGTLARWQGGGSGPGGSCSIVSPARRSAWGAIKSLYR